MIVDTHAHLDSAEFAPDLPQVLSEAQSAGIEWIVCPGTSAHSSRQVIELASRYGIIAPAVGIHPNYAGEADPVDWKTIEKLADLPQVVAIGETGLDRHWDFTPWSVQEEYFDRHLWLAGKKDLPVIVHCREAEADVLRHLQEAQRQHRIIGVVHAYSSPPELAQAVVGMGFYVSFAGSLTYRNKKFDPLRVAVGVVPTDRLLVETDSPHLVPEPYRGKLKRNRPALIVETLRYLARLVKLEYEHVCRITTESALRLFRLSSVRSSI
ncbi:MAG: TatD family hydrolase [Thermoguttaceae bacterium]|nr:TatD family hydrolase [Thermoguttaceae bacterium]